MADSKEPVHTAEQVNLLRQSQQPLLLAQNVYDVSATPTPPAGWKVVASSTNAWKSGFFARIYEKQGLLAPGEQKYVVAFRGTNKITDPLNFVADFQIVTRALPDQHLEAVNFVKGFCTKNNISTSDLALTGHSLGGYLAMTVGMELGTARIWAFNSPGPTRDLRDVLSHKIPGVSKPPCDSLVQVRSDHDAISRWQYPEGKIISVATNGVSHGLENLKQGVDAVVTGHALPHETIAKKTLSTIFNDVAKELSQSPVAAAIIDRLFGGKGHPPRPADCRCA